jgi:hypothetical protein
MEIIFAKNIFIFSCRWPARMSNDFTDQETFLYEITCNYSKNALYWLLTIPPENKP